MPEFWIKVNDDVYVVTEHAFFVERNPNVMVMSHERTGLTTYIAWAPGMKVEIDLKGFAENKKWREEHEEKEEEQKIIVPPPGSPMRGLPKKIQQH